jgi:hypothetical protein
MGASAKIDYQMGASAGMPPQLMATTQAAAAAAAGGGGESVLRVHWVAVPKVLRARRVNRRRRRFQAGRGRRPPTLVRPVRPCRRSAAATIDDDAASDRRAVRHGHVY